jgi:non-heme chloroperoxidase
MLKTAANRHPDRGVRRLSPGARRQPRAVLDVASGPFYAFNRPDATVSQGIIQNWWRQGMMGSAKAHYEGIKAFSETDQTEDLKAITVPTLVLQGEDDQVEAVVRKRQFSNTAASNGKRAVARNRRSHSRAA